MPSRHAGVELRQEHRWLEIPGHAKINSLRFMLAKASMYIAQLDTPYGVAHLRYVYVLSLVMVSSRRMYFQNLRRVHFYALLISCQKYRSRVSDHSDGEH
jgi:hypothetical protein